MLNTASANMVGSTAGFHRNNTRWQRSKIFQQSEALYTPAQRHCAVFVQARNAANCLSRVNIENCDNQQDASSVPVHSRNNSCVPAGG